MPSFASDVKSELVNFVNYRKCCDKTQLNAMLKIRATLSENRIDFNSTNAAVTRKVLKLVKAVYSTAKTEVAVIRYKKFHLKNRYIIRIFRDAETQSLFEEMSINKFPDEDCCRNSYLRGLFMSAGTVNRPEKGYHLEINSNTEEVGKFVKKCLSQSGFGVGLFQRKERFVAYLKTFEDICDFLYLIHAARNLKEVRSQVNRIVNCETANLQRSVNAAQQQIQDIKIICANEKLFKKMDEKMKETAEMRLKFPELNISEIAEKMFLSASGLKYRFKKIHLLANPKDRWKEFAKKRKKKWIRKKN